MRLVSRISASVNEDRTTRKLSLQDPTGRRGNGTPTEDDGGGPKPLDLNRENYVSTTYTPADGLTRRGNGTPVQRRWEPGCLATCRTCWEFLSGAMGTAGGSNPIHPVETAACANFAATPGKAPMVPKDPTRETLHGTDSWTLSISPAAHTRTLERVRRHWSDCLADALPIIKHSASSP